jgi:hypothetical protein
MPGEARAAAIGVCLAERDQGDDIPRASTPKRVDAQHDGALGGAPALVAQGEVDRLSQHA